MRNCRMSILTPIVWGLGTAVAWYSPGGGSRSLGAKEALARLGK